jgi:DNA (cytosine-5)-methyltransferase 1
MYVEPLRFYEFFAGGGMARLGLGERWECLFANDFDAVKAAAYRDNFPGEHFSRRTSGPFPRPISQGGPPRVGLLAVSGLQPRGGRAGLAGGRSSALLGFWRLVEGLAAEGRAPPDGSHRERHGLLSARGRSDFRRPWRSG